MIRIREKLGKALQGFSTASFFAGVLCAIVIAAACLLLYLYFPLSASVKRPDSLAAMKKVGEAEDIIRRRFLEEVDETKQTDAMLKGLVDGLGDTYASYYSKEEYEEIKRDRAGLTKGIGIQIVQDSETGELVVVYVLEDSPAERAGVLADDILIAVNGESLEGRLSTDAADMIRAAEGPVTLTILRSDEEEPVELTMEKEDIKGTAVYGTMVEDNIGYIQILTFNELTSEQFRESYAELQEMGVKGLIIDLRNNLGGLVSACCDTAEQILPEGVIVYEQDRNGKEKHRDSSGKTPIGIPLVLLVNGYTASASEIFTGAVRDYGLGTIVGETTYGKGIEQNTYLLSDGSALKLTTTVYYTPEHEDINGIGIRPDEIVELTEEDETDVQLERAMEILEEETGKETDHDE